MSQTKRFLRAQFSLDSPPFLRIVHGDILDVVSKQQETGYLEVVNVRTGQSGLAPRTSSQFYVDVEKEEVHYLQPVILMGPVSAHIQDMLTQRQPQLFSTPTPHTTRGRRLNERNGVDYWFVKKTTLEQMMSNGLFVDCFQSNDFLYGITEAAIRSVAQKEKKHCLLESNTEVSRLLHRKIHPIVLFVGTQNWERLHDVLMFEGSTVAESQNIFSQSEQTIQKNIPYLHAIICGNSLEETYEAVSSKVSSIQTEGWVPRISRVHNQRLI